MAIDDLDMMVAPYGVTKMKLGETEVNVRRVLLRGQQKRVRAALVAGSQMTFKLQELLSGVTDSMGDDMTKMLEEKASLLEAEFEEVLRDGIRAMIIREIPFLDEMTIDSLSAVFGAVKDVQDRAFAESMVNSFPPSGG